MSEPKDAKGIFLAAVDIADAAERAAFVERSCGDDPALRQRVEDLLRAYGQSGGPLDKLAAAMAPTEIAEPIREQVGATIGPYKLMEQIGEGGFGLVFVAEQERPIRRKVALKIIKPGMDTRDVIARFEAERQALALMDHPNIARVLDAGTTQSGRPYFVMELVRGIPITDYCDKNQLTPRERLELFIPVCNAIQHAHLKGLIHRDIKPSNVLVTMHDGKPVVKVIDFGVAKALHQSLTDRTVYTRFAQMIGTPLYMSPEQAEMSGLDIDTRTDVYSLGVLLYELLTGTTPLDKKRLAQAAYDELLKIIREDDPPKPSVRLSHSTDSLPSIAALRKTEPAKLSKMFHGDVDWIAMKALEKDRTRRYETANAFAADVLRYLNDEPIEACPPSTAYRLRKFARKHRKPVIAMLTIAAVLVLGIAGTTWGLFHAKLAERAADTSKKEAIDALGQAKRDRDAKEVERDHAERQFANGLLRPIGFANAPTDPAELRSFVDWSAIKESRLKVRMLEIALENPETALRVALRAERVIQSCVSLSPSRRAQAIKLVSKRQRDLTADPRVRVAACWLALELGSTDLPAWAESCNHLSGAIDPSNWFADRFGEFVTFAAGRSSPQQIAELKPDPLIAIIQKSKYDATIWGVYGGLAGLAPHLQRAQVENAGDALISILEHANDSDAFGLAIEGLIALAPRLNPAQAKNAWDALIAPRQNRPRFPNPGANYAEPFFIALAPRLDHAQVNRAADALIAILEEGKDNNLFALAIEGLIGLAPRLEPMQAKRAWDALTAPRQRRPDGLSLGVNSREPFLVAQLAPRLDHAQAERAVDALISILQKPNDKSTLIALSNGLAALAPRLEPVQAKRAWDSLLAILAESTDEFERNAASSAMVPLRPRLDQLQVNRALDALVATLQKPKDKSAFVATSEGLAALGPRLNQSQVNRAMDALIALPEEYWASSAALVSLAPRMAPAQANRSWDILIAFLEKPEHQSVHWTSSGGLVVLAPRIDRAQVKRTGDALIAVLEKSNDQSPPFYAQHALVALAPRLEPSQVNRASNCLIAILEKSGKQEFPFWLPTAFGALARRLDASQAKHACDGLMAILEKQPQIADNAVCEALVALAPQLEPASRDELSTKATFSVLTYCALFGPPYSGAVSDPRAILIARSISTPRSLAKLLSHPACIAELRQGLLNRFEELVLYHGNPVFWKPDNPSAYWKPETPDGKQHRFHNLHDTAAWIHQNWPDFDLEASCPVTWPGESHDTRSAGSR